jgi:hypothetical protein
MKYRGAGTFAERVKKSNERYAKARNVAINKVKAMPVIPRVILNANYVNPITLEFPRGTVVYEIRNKFTGRTNYYNKVTLRKLITAWRGDYALLMMNPKEPIPGVRNPITRNPIYPRNVRRVTVAPKKKTPSPKTAAKKIQSALRKHVSKKRESETGRAGTQRVSK